MLIIFYLVLMFTVGRCTDKQTFDTKTAHVGENVKMTCSRTSSGTIFWVRFISGNFPEVLGKTFDFETNSRITTSEESRLFVLHIKKAQLSDAAFYYCFKIHQRALEILNGIDLRVKGPNPETKEAPAYDAVPPKDSVSLYCSVVSDAEDKICPKEKCVCCLRAGTHQSPLCFNYTQGCSIYEEDKNPDKLSSDKCVCSFLKNISSSDAWTHHCAVDTHGGIFPENRSKLNNDGNALEKNSTVIALLCAALTLSLVVIICLVMAIKNLKEKFHAADLLQTNAVSSFQESQQADADSLIYSAPAFTRSASKAELRKAKSAENESIYSDVKTLGLEDNQNSTG